VGSGQHQDGARRLLSLGQTMKRYPMPGSVMR
jgi:hypothetical protein